MQRFEERTTGDNKDTWKQKHAHVNMYIHTSTEPNRLGFLRCRGPEAIRPCFWTCFETRTTTELEPLYYCCYLAKQEQLPLPKEGKLERNEQVLMFSAHMKDLSSCPPSARLRPRFRQHLRQRHERAPPSSSSCWILLSELMWMLLLLLPAAGGGDTLACCSNHRLATLACTGEEILGIAVVPAVAPAGPAKT